MLTEFRFALLRLWRAPLASAVMVLGLALGLAAAMTVFSVMHTLLLSDSTIPNNQRVQLLQQEFSAAGQSVRLQSWSYPGYVALRDALAPDQQAIAVTRTPLSLTMGIGTGSRRVLTELIAPGYFDALGVAVALGAPFAPGAPGAAATEEDRRVWLSHGLWSQEFAADPGVLGRLVNLQGVSFVIAGVLPAGFRGLSEQAAVWAPISAAPSLTFARRLQGATSFWHEVFVVSDDGSTASGMLDSRLQLPASRVREAVGLRLGGELAQLQLQTKSWQELRVDPALRRATVAIAVCTLLLLAIVSLNLALLALARLDQRRRELGVRIALGAGRSALLRSLSAELLLVFAGGLAGAWLLSVLAVDWLSGFGELVQVGVHSLADLRIGGASLLLGSVLALLALILVLSGPARAILRLNVPRAFAARDGGRQLQGRRWLAGTQFAMATALAIGASFAALSAWRAIHVPLGFDPGQVLSAQFSVPAALAPADGVSGLLQRWTEQLKQQPGVAAAATAACLPIRGGCDNVLLEAVPRAASEDWPVNLNMVSGDYFQVLSIQLEQGRVLDARDTAQSTPVAVLSRSAARQYFGDRPAVGQRVKLSIGFPEDPLGALVVGVVDDVFDSQLDEAPAPMVYLSALQTAYDDNLVIVRARPGLVAGSLAPVLQSTLQTVQPGLALFDGATMEQRFDGLTARRRLVAGLVGCLAALAVLLAGSGIYAVFSLLVQRRSREFGVRMALGATAGKVQASVFGEALSVAAVATVAGLLLGGFGLSWMASVLPQLSGARLPVFASVAALMLSILFIAGWWPARRAARADPMRVLRQEV